MIDFLIILMAVVILGPIIFALAVIGIIACLYIMAAVCGLLTFWVKTKDD